jgi:uncharacterized membrane protein YhaH (DUF805 family)
MKYFIKAMQNYATFSGRARRSEYWYFTLFNFIISFAFGFICALAGKPDLYMISTVVLFIPSLAVGVRRMHDVGKSGLFLLIPFYNFILSVTEGDIGDNRYGPDPKTIDN